MKTFFRRVCEAVRQSICDLVFVTLWLTVLFFAAFIVFRAVMMTVSLFEG